MAAYTDAQIDYMCVKSCAKSCADDRWRIYICSPGSPLAGTIREAEITIENYKSAASHLASSLLVQKTDNSPGS